MPKRRYRGRGDGDGGGSDSEAKSTPSKNVSVDFALKGKASTLHNNPIQSIVFGILLVILLLHLLLRTSQSSISLMQNKISISITACNLGAALIGYLFINAQLSENDDKFMCNLYLGLTIILFVHWCYLVFIAGEGFDNEENDNEENDD